MDISLKTIAGSLSIIYLIILFILCFRDLKISKKEKKKKGIVINTILAIWTLISLIYVVVSFYE